MTPKDYFAQKGINTIPSSGGREVRIVCPRCKNPKQKCFVNSTSGNWYCFHCDTGGTFKTLLQELKLKSDVDITLSEDRHEWSMVTPIDEEIVKENHDRLLNMLRTDTTLQDYLHKKRGYTSETIEKFKLGWGEGSNLLIPIYSGENCINFKIKSDPTRPVSSGAIYSLDGRGKKRLFNDRVLDVTTKKDLERVILCEGEWDCMLLDQMGYSAVTSTAGALSFDESWVSAFRKFRKIYLCFDNDLNGTGQRGTKKTADMFLKHGIRVHIIKLPSPTVTEEKMDVTNFFTNRQKTKADFTLLLKEASEYSGGLLSNEQYRFLDMASVSDIEFPVDQWIVDHLVPTEGLTCIAGLPATMKSYFTNYIASCIVQGKPVLGELETTKVPILFIDKENRLSRIKQRFSALGASYEALKDIYVLSQGDFMVEKEDSIIAAEAFIKTHNIKLTIIDTMVRIHSKVENDASEMNRVFHVFKRLQSAGSAVLFIHHFNKKGSGVFQTEDIRQLLRGSGDILAMLDSYFALKIVENGLLRLDVGKSRDEEPMKPILIEPAFFEGETSFNYMGEANDDDAYRQMRVETEIEKLLLGKSLSRQEIINALSSRVSAPTVDRGLKKLKKLDVIISVMNSHETIYSLNAKNKQRVQSESLRL